MLLRVYHDVPFSESSADDGQDTAPANFKFHIKLGLDLPDEQSGKRKFRADFGPQ